MYDISRAYVRVVEVHKVSGITAASNAVEVDLGAGAAWTSVSHLPEVGLLVEGQYAGRGQQLTPDVPRLDVRFNAVSAAEVRDVQTLLYSTTTTHRTQGTVAV